MDDLRQYRQFLAVAEEGNFRRAAEKLGLTHGALSQTVMRLEDTYRVKLFERTKRGMEPTAYGRLLMEKARQIIHEMEAFRIEVVRLENRELGKLVIGCDPNYSMSVVGPTVMRLLEVYPNWAFEVRATPWRQLREQFDSREIDVYVGLQPTEDLSRYTVDRIPGLPGVFVCRPGHPLTERKGRLTMAEITEFQLAFLYLPRPKDLGVDEDHYNYDPALNIETNDIAMLKQIVRSTDAVGPGLLHAFIDELDRGQLVLLDVANYPQGSTIEEIRARQDEQGNADGDIVSISHKTQVPIPALVEFKNTLHQVVSGLCDNYDELRASYLKRAR